MVVAWLAADLPGFGSQFVGYLTTIPPAVNRRRGVRKQIMSGERKPGVNEDEAPRPSGRERKGGEAGRGTARGLKCEARPPISPPSSPPAYVVCQN